MKIIIIGAGRIGESVAEHLLSEDNDITVIDPNAERLRALQERYDLRGVVGSGTEIDVLQEAGAQDTELLLACASLEETNLVACKIAQLVFNIPTRVARVHTSYLSGKEQLLSKDGFAVDSLLCPEDSLTRYIAKLIEFPQALQVRNFANGLACLVSVRARAGSPLVGHTISEVTQIMPHVAMRIVAIYRRLWDGPDQLIMTENATRIESDDEVFVLAAKEQVPAILNGLHSSPNVSAKTTQDASKQPDEPYKTKPQRIMIVGGGRVGQHIASHLASTSINHNIKVIEKSPDRCITLASILKESVLVLQGNGTDEDLLLSEDIASVDLFVSVTHEDEDNIMSSLLAKSLGAKRVLALINRRSYAELIHSTQIDIALSPAQTILGELLQHVRKGEVRNVHSLRGGLAEALEILALGTHKTSKVIGRQVAELKLPAGVQIGLVIRGIGDHEKIDVQPSSDNNAQNTEPPQEDIKQIAQIQEDSPNNEVQIIIPTDQTVIEHGDHVIIFLPNKRLIQDVEKLFKVGISFF